MRQELIRRGMQVIEKMERETGLEPATSSLVSCGRLSIGQLPRSHQTAAVANRSAGYQPALHDASYSTFMIAQPPIGTAIPASQFNAPDHLATLAPRLPSANARAASRKLNAGER